MEPLGEYEEIEIRAASGAALRAICREPEGSVRASVVVVPAQKKLADALARRGYRAVTFDFVAAAYDERVELELPLVVECVRARAEGHRVIALGYAEAAALVVAAQAHAKADALVLLGGSVWRTARHARDYVRSARNVDVPVAAVVGTRDRIRCHPLAGEAIARLCGGPVEVFRANATHRGLLRADAAIADALDWAQARP